MLIVEKRWRAHPPLVLSGTQNGGDKNNDVDEKARAPAGGRFIRAPAEVAVVPSCVLSVGRPRMATIDR